MRKMVENSKDVNKREINCSRHEWLSLFSNELSNYYGDEEMNGDDVVVPRT